MVSSGGQQDEHCPGGDLWPGALCDSLQLRGGWAARMVFFFGIVLAMFMGF